MNRQLGNEAIRSQLHATIEEFAADGYTHVGYWPRCRMTRLRPIGWLPRLSFRTHHCTAFITTSLCRVRRAGSLGQAVAIGGRARQAARAAWVI